MAKLTKKQKAAAAIVDSHKFYDLDEAVKLVKEAASANSMKPSKLLSISISTRNTLISSSAALPYSPQAPAKPRKSWFSPKTTRKTKPRQQALIT